MEANNVRQPDTEAASRGATNTEEVAANDAS